MFYHGLNVKGHGTLELPCMGLFMRLYPHLLHTMYQIVCARIATHVAHVPHDARAPFHGPLRYHM